MSNVFLSLIVVYLGAGILLMVIITKFKLTVTNGILNGLVLYIMPTLCTGTEASSFQTFQMLISCVSS